jgi:hypothetical protein
MAQASPVFMSVLANIRKVPENIDKNDDFIAAG